MHDTIPPTTVTCPDWCTLPAGHGYESEDFGVLIRNHTAEILDVTWTAHGQHRRIGVDVSTHEKSLSDDGPVVELGEPLVFVDGAERGITGPQARELARALLEAADVYDRVNGLQR